MKCEYFRRLIVLQAGCLITKSQEKELVEHLKGCHPCNEYIANMNLGNSMIDKLKVVKPLQEKSYEITRNVMAAIENSEGKQSERIFIRLIDHFLYILDRKRIKYSLAFVSVIIGIAFVVQQFIIYSEIETLQQQIRKTGYMLKREGNPGERKLKILTNLLKNREDDEEFFEDIRLNRNDFYKLLDEYKDIKSENEILKNLLNDSLVQKFNEFKSRERHIEKTEVKKSNSSQNI